MLNPIGNVYGSQKSNELVSLEHQVKALGLQDELGEQIYHHDRNELLQQMTDAIKITSQDITKTITETSFKNNKVYKKVKEKKV